MRNFLLRLSKTINNNWLRGAFGFFICILSVFCALWTAPSPDFILKISQFLNWCFSFLFGGIFAYIIYLLLFLFGIRLIFSFKKRIKINLNLTIFGCVFITLGSIILIANSMSYHTLNTSLDYGNFSSYFNSYVVYEFPNVDSFRNGGIIGMFLVATINSGLTYIGSNVIGSIFLVAGIFLAFSIPFIKCVKVISDYFNQVFAKKIIEEDSSYDVAKDIDVSIEAVSTEPEILTNNTSKIETLVEAKVPQDDIYDEIISSKNFEATPIEITQTNGLVKASFRPEETTKEVEYVVKQQNLDLSEKVTKAEIDKPVVHEQTTIFDFEKNEEDEINTVSPEKEVEIIVKDDEFPSKEETINMNNIQIETVKDDTIKVNSSIFKNEEEFESFATMKNVPANTNVRENEYSNKIELPKKKKNVKFIAPSPDLLEDRSSKADDEENKKVCDARMEAINTAFNELGVGASVISYTCGPSVTRYDLRTEKNVSVSGISKYIDDISIRLGGLDCRFVPIVQGKSTSGLEIANGKSKLVNFKDCLLNLPENKKGQLYVPFGQDIGGQYLSADLRDFPHLLVCGTTGSGKSIFMHSLIMSLIMKNSIDDLRLIMIDPKRVEFGKYKEMPHLLCPPINDSNKAYIALQKLVDVMEERYSLFEETGVSNIKQYNEEALDNGKDKMPYIVLICDEFADLMDTNRKCSEPVVRLGQKSRAAGIHMIIATQRPSTNVITGTIKANLPTRVALSCSSYTDSMTILGQGGAEKLLGNGDMLVMCSLISKAEFTRVQGCFVDNKEIKNVVTYLKENYETHYDPIFLDLEEKTKSTLTADQFNEIRESANDDKYEQVKQWAMQEEYASISKIVRNFGVGFPKAGKFFARLEKEGIISNVNEPNNSKGRKVLIHNYSNFNSNAEETPASQRGGSIEQSTFIPD